MMMIITIIIIILTVTVIITLTSWCKSRGKKEGKSGKVPGPEERDWKSVETQKCKSRACSDRSSWKYYKRIL